MHGAGAAHLMKAENTKTSFEFAMSISETVFGGKIRKARRP
jgi:hypothetical protein